MNHGPKVVVHEALRDLVKLPGDLPRHLGPHEVFGFPLVAEAVGALNWTRPFVKCSSHQVHAQGVSKGGGSSFCEATPDLPRATDLADLLDGGPAVTHTESKSEGIAGSHQGMPASFQVCSEKWDHRGNRRELAANAVPYPRRGVAVRPHKCVACVQKNLNRVA